MSPSFDARAGLTGLALVCFSAGVLIGPTHAQTPGRATEDGGVVFALPGSGAPALDIDRCIGLALEANESLMAKRAALGELEARKLQARATGLPSIDLVGNFSRGRDPSFALDSTFGGGGEDATLPANATAVDSLLAMFGDFIPAPEDIPAQSFWRTSADMYWELNPTQVWYAIGAAGSALRQQEAVIEDAEHRTIEQTMTDYFGVLLAHQQVASVQAELAARNEFLEITRRRYTLELATPLDTLQARVSMANLLPSLRRAQQDLRNAGQALNTRMGRNPRTPLAVELRFPLEYEELDRDRVVALALSRPGIREAELATDFQRGQRSTIGADRHPVLAFNASYGYVAKDLGGLDDTGHEFWSTGLTLTIPLFDGLATKGRLREQEAGIRRLEHELSDRRRQAELEVLSALGELDVARENLSAAELNMQSAETALSQMNLRYEVGKAGYLDVLNAQADRFVARSNLIQARHDVLVWTTTLKRAMGMRPTEPLARALEKKP